MPFLITPSTFSFYDTQQRRECGATGDPHISPIYTLYKFHLLHYGQQRLFDARERTILLSSSSERCTQHCGRRWERRRYGFEHTMGRSVDLRRWAKGIDEEEDLAETTDMTVDTLGRFWSLSLSIDVSNALLDPRRKQECKRRIEIPRR